MTNLGDTVLATENLSYCYGKLTVWEEVNLCVKSGEVIFLLGQNGAGKSTLLRCLAGRSCPASGEITLCGEKFTGKNREQRSKISFVSDTPSFYDDLTAEEHLQFVLRANGRGDDYTQAEKLLDDFGLLRYVRQYPSSYSRGMREKLALVIAFMIKPRLLLFDEPYGPLDSDASQMLSSLIKSNISTGSSVILSCHHSIPDLEPNKVLLLDEGALHTRDKSILDEFWGKKQTFSSDDWSTSEV